MILSSFIIAGGGTSLTSFALLREIGILPSRHQDRATITIAKPIPASVIELILLPRLVQEQSDSIAELRYRRQQVECSLIRELVRITTDGVAPGTVHDALVVS